MNQNSLSRQVQETLDAFHMTEPGDRIVCGVSGGADSVCLLLLLKDLEKERGIRIFAVHVHHGLRERAEEDADFTRKLCKWLDIPVRIFYVDAAKEARQQKMSVEEAGRKLRYECFARACREWEQKDACRDPEKEAGREENREGAFGLPPRWKIAVAHHKEDCAETVLWNLCRGASLKGLAGIRPVNGSIIRPLIGCSRAQIEEELQKRDQIWRTDETNEELCCTRNFLRGRILPELSGQVNSAAVDHICRAAQELAEADRFLKRQTQEALSRCRDTAGGEECCRVSSLKELEPYLRRRVLYEALCGICGQKDLTSDHVRELEQLLETEGSHSLDLPGAVRARKVYDRLFLERRQPDPDSEESVKTALEEENSFFPLRKEDYRIRKFPYSGNPQDIPSDPYTKWLDYDRISSFLTFRTRQERDRLAIGEDGPKDGTSGEKTGFCYKKLTRIMIDRKIPADLRSRIVFPADGDRILWVPGYRIGADFRITGRTRTVLELSLSVSEGEKR